MRVILATGAIPTVSGRQIANQPVNLRLRVRQMQVSHSWSRQGQATEAGVDGETNVGTCMPRVDVGSGRRLIGREDKRVMRELRAGLGGVSVRTATDVESRSSRAGCWMLVESGSHTPGTWGSCSGLTAGAWHSRRKACLRAFPLSAGA